MGLFTNRAIAAGLLATVAFTSVAFDTSPVEAAQSQAAKDRAFAAGKQACINLAREQAIETFDGSTIGFASNEHIGCTFNVGSDGSTPFKKYYDKGSERDYNAYSTLYNKAVAKEERALERQDLAEQRALERARRNDPFTKTQNRAGRQVENRINKAVDGAIRGVLDNIFN